MQCFPTYHFRCTYTDTQARGFLGTESREQMSSPEECIMKCRQTKDCLQWEWRGPNLDDLFKAKKELK